MTGTEQPLLAGLLLVPALLGADAASPPEAPPPATASACPVSDGLPCVLSLRGPGAPAASAACTAAPWSRFLTFRETAPFADSNGDGWWETAISLALDPTKQCGCARFRIHFEGPIDDWSFNIGNSDTNDGYGGDHGTAGGWSAEVYLESETLAVMSKPRGAQGRARAGFLPDRLLQLELPGLGGQWMDLKVCDQSLTFELAPEMGRVRRWQVGSPNQELLFALGPRAGAKPNALYAAFNRVIRSVEGKPAHGRVGTGTSRVEISLSP